MSNSITFTPAEIEVMVAILNQIDDGKLNTKRLCEDLGVESKGTATSRLCRLRAKIGNRPKGPRKSSPTFGASPTATPAASMSGKGMGRGKKGKAAAAKKRKIKDEDDAGAFEEGSLEDEVTRKMPERSARGKKAKVEQFEDSGHESEDYY